MTPGLSCGAAAPVPCRVEPVSRAARPAPVVSRRWRGRLAGSDEPVIVVLQRDDVVMLSPHQARRLAYQLLRAAHA